MASLRLRPSIRWSRSKTHSWVATCSYVGFEVQQEVTLKVYKTDTVGLLVDDLQKIGGIKFESFAWKGNKVLNKLSQEIEDESAVVEGAVERAK